MIESEFKLYLDFMLSDWLTMGMDDKEFQPNDLSEEKQRVLFRKLMNPPERWVSIGESQAKFLGEYFESERVSRLKGHRVWAIPQMEWDENGREKIGSEPRILVHRKTSGGEAGVWFGFDRKLGEVAVRVISDTPDGEELSQEQVKKVLQAEIEASEVVGSRYAIPVKDLVQMKLPGSEKYMYGLVMGDLRAHETDTLIDRYVDIRDNPPELGMKGAQFINLAKVLARDVGTAIDRAAEKGIYHRDIKPGNIMITAPTTDLDAGNRLVKFNDPDQVFARVFDWGLANTVMEHKGMTGKSGGTPKYMSPETARGEEDSTIASEVYKLALVCYENLAQRNYCDAKSSDPVDIMLWMGKAWYSPKHQAALDLRLGPVRGARVGLVMAKALHQESEERYQSGREFGVALWSALDKKRPVLE